MEQELSLLVYIPSIPRLNPKSFYSAYDVKTYLLLIVIYPLNGDIKPGSPLGTFEKNRLMLVYSSPSLLLVFITHTLH